MSKIFISHCTNGDKCKKLESDFERFLFDVLKMKEGEVFSASKLNDIPAGSDFNAKIYKELRDCEYVVFLITEEFMKSAPCMAEIGGAYAYGKKYRCIPLMERNVHRSFINSTPLLGIQGQYYEDQGVLEQVGKTLYGAHIISKSPEDEDFKNDLEAFCRETGWGKYKSDLKKYKIDKIIDSSHCIAGVNEFVRNLQDDSGSSDEARFLLACVLNDGVLTEKDLGTSKKIYDLLIKSSNNGYSWAKVELADLLCEGDLNRSGSGFYDIFQLLRKATDCEVDCPSAWIKELYANNLVSGKPMI